MTAGRGVAPVSRDATGSTGSKKGRKKAARKDGPKRKGSSRTKHGGERTAEKRAGKGGAKSAGTSAGTARHPAALRRRLIVESARDVIAERGMSATRMRDLATAADVSLGTLTYHFSGIEEILAEAVKVEMEEFYQPIVDRARAAPTGRAALWELIEGFFNDDDRTRDHWLLWLDFWTLASHDATQSHWHVEIYDNWRDDVGALIARGRADGSLTVADPEFATTQFLVLTDGTAAQAFLTGRATWLTDPRGLMRDMVADLFEFDPTQFSASQPEAAQPRASRLHAGAVGSAPSATTGKP